MVVDAGPFTIDGNRLNSRLWAIIKRATERGSDVVDAHLAVVAERLGTFVLTGDPDDPISLGARPEQS